LILNYDADKEVPFFGFGKHIPELNSNPNPNPNPNSNRWNPKIPKFKFDESGSLL